MNEVEFPSDQDAGGRTLGAEERAYVEEVLASGRLFGPKGVMVSRLEQTFASMMDVPHARAVSSGTAGVHCALGALDLEPGDEVLTTAITDMGAILPILNCGAVPIFCDVDPETLNVTAETLAAMVTPRTKAVVLTHLFGLPCETTPIMELARDRGIMVVEDCSQAYLARDHGRLVGTIGDIGVFSLQQGKHATCGEGGLVISRDPALARRMKLFGDKAWPYGESSPDHEFLSTNYRMSELQAAVALAQIEKLEASVDHRCRMVGRFREAVGPEEGGVISFQDHPPGGRHTYWRVPVMVRADLGPQAVDAFAEAVRGKGVRAMPRYIQKPAFECAIIRDQRTFGESRWPFSLWESRTGKAYSIPKDSYPGTYEGLSRVVVIDWNERFLEHHVDLIASTVAQAAQGLRTGKVETDA